MMIGRRTFLASTSTMAGVLFVNRAVGGAMASGSQSTPASGRREVRVGGRRIKTIDVHAHCIVAGAAEIAGQPTPNNSALMMGTGRLRQMDEQGIDVEALSINPTWYAASRDVAQKLVQFQNEQLAEFCRAHSDRFVAFATVALQHPDLAVQQLEDGVRRLGLRGGSVGATINGEELSSPRFDPFWSTAEALNVPIFIHPQGVPELRTRLQGNGLLTNVIGNPLETTIALSHLIFEGTLDRFPRLKLCAAHGGGYLPSYADRSDHGCVTFPDQCSKTLKKHPTEYLKQIYVDSLVFTSEALRHLIAQVGVGQIVMGTDYPFPWTTTAVDHVLNMPGVSDDQKVAMLGGNAAKLLNIPL
jgi:aminocarboxymuconate-semialdehyde decarboxylase